MECSMSKYHFTDWLIWLIATNNIFEKKNPVQTTEWNIFDGWCRFLHQYYPFSLIMSVYIWFEKGWSSLFEIMVCSNVVKNTLKMSIYDD